MTTRPAPTHPDYLELLSLLSGGLAAGAFVLARIGLRPAAAALPTGAHITFRQALIQRLHRLMPALMGPAAFTTSALAVRDRGHAAAGRRNIAAASWILALVITRLGNVPLNEQMARWTSDSPPSNWRRSVALWNAYDTARAWAAAAGYLSQLAARI